MGFYLNVLLEEKILHTYAETFPFKWLNSIFSENIIDVSVTKNFVIVTTKYMNPDTNKALTNNIDGYDWDGNHLWNISDIIKEFNKNDCGFFQSCFYFAIALYHLSSKLSKTYCYLI